MILVSETFGRYSNHHCGTLMNDISALYKRGVRGMPGPFFHHVRIQQEASSLQSTRGTWPEPGHAGTLILDFQFPKPWEIKFCCVKIPSRWYFVIMAWTNQGKHLVHDEWVLYTTCICWMNEWMFNCYYSTCFTYYSIFYCLWHFLQPE